MKQTLQFVFLLFISAVSLSSCKKEKPLVGDNALTAFTFKAEHHPELFVREISGEIREGQIVFTLPQELDRSQLIASFTHTGEKVLVGQQAQQSGVSVNDFSLPLVYTVQGKDGSSRRYEVVIQQEPDSGLAFDSFSFENQNNAEFSGPSRLIRRGDTLYVRLRGEAGVLAASFQSSAESVQVNGVEQVSGKSFNDFSAPQVYTLTSRSGMLKSYTVIAERSSGIPHIYLNTQGARPIVSKEDYLQADVRIEGEGLYDDFMGTTGVRGRGNSTWTHPKKPYRLKLDKKASLFGLGEAKDWVLLSNYLDESLMLNAVAMKMGKLLDMAYTNTIIPVDLTLNGEYLGSYMLTQQVEVKQHRVELDEGGILLELDQYFDEEYKFRSAMYGLPVMMKYPKQPDAAHFEQIQKDFRRLENAMYNAAFPQTNYLDYIDADALVDYMLLMTFTLNQEINHPKSVFMYKKNAGGKYTMGPIWDFDWAFSYDTHQTHFVSATTPIFVEGGNYPGRAFFGRFLQDPLIKSMYQSKWNAFRSAGLNELLDFVDDYAQQIEESFALDYAIWQHGSEDFSGSVERLKRWLSDRTEYMDTYLSQL